MTTCPLPPGNATALPFKCNSMPPAFPINSEYPVEASSSTLSPGVKLSEFDHVIVGARITGSGNASPGAGDLEGFSGVVNTVNAENITVNVGYVILD